MAKKNIRNRISYKLLIFLLMIFYVLLGTIYYEWAVYNFGGVGILFYLFLPTNYLLSWIEFTDRASVLITCLSQITTLFILYFIFRLIIFFLKTLVRK